MEHSQTVPVSQSAWQSAAAWLRRLAIPAGWRWALACFLAGRVLYSAWGALIWAMGWHTPDANHIGLYFDIQPLIDGLPGALLGMWQRWDTIHYLRIAIHGYNATELTAFYPLYPLLGRWLSQVSGLPALPALLLVSNLAFLISLALLYEIITRYFNETLARQALVTALIFPTSFYFYAAYPVSPLLMVILLAFWLALRQKWLAAAVVNLLAGLLHTTSVVLVILLGWQVVQLLRAERARRHWVTVVVPFTNLLGVALFLAWREAAGFMPYATLLKEWFKRSFNPPWTSAALYIDYLANLPPGVASLIPWISFATLLLVAGLTLFSFRRIPWVLWLYQAGLMGFLFCNNVVGAPMQSMLRYTLVMFPLFALVPQPLSNRAIKLLVFTLAVLISLICSAVFFLWGSDIA